jgi:hypothetical protein
MYFDRNIAERIRIWLGQQDMLVWTLILALVRNDTVPVPDCFDVITSTCLDFGLFAGISFILALRSSFLTICFQSSFFSNNQNKAEEMTWNLLDMYSCTS